MIVLRGSPRVRGVPVLSRCAWGGNGRGGSGCRRSHCRRSHCRRSHCRRSHCRRTGRSWSVRLRGCGLLLARRAAAAVRVCGSLSLWRLGHASRRCHPLIRPGQVLGDIGSGRPGRHHVTGHMRSSRSAVQQVYRRTIREVPGSVRCVTPTAASEPQGPAVSPGLRGIRVPARPRRPPRPPLSGGLARWSRPRFRQLQARRPQ